MIVNHGKRPELFALTGIRGLAALCVLLFHFFSTFKQLLPEIQFLEPLATRGYLGVDLFFILSGFILVYAYAAQIESGEVNYPAFIWRRLARIYPNHLVTLAFLGVTVACANILHIPISGDYPASHLPFQLLLLHAWPGIYHLPLDWNYPSWSISAEFFAYLFIFPLVARWIHSCKSAVFAFVIGYGAIAVWACWLGEVVPKMFHPILQVSLEFTAGGFFCFVFLKSKKAGRIFQRSATLIFLLVILALWIPLPVSVVVMLFPALILGLTKKETIVGKVVGSSAIRWLGEISYALYMTHGIVQKFFKILLPLKYFSHWYLLFRIFAVTLILGLSVGVASLLYYIVEEPARKYLQGHPLIAKFKMQH